MTFQSFESYHGDYYYVLSGKNNVYVQYMNGTGEREPMKVTVNKDENGNPVITQLTASQLARLRKNRLMPMNVLFTT